MLNIDIEFRRGVLFIRLFGNLIDTTKKKLKDEVINLINRSGITNIVINLENINNIDQSGLDMLWTLKSLIEAKNGRIILCNMPREIEQSFNKDKAKIYLFESKNELTALNTFNI